MLGFRPEGNEQASECFKEEMLLAPFSEPLTLNSDHNENCLRGKLKENLMPGPTRQKGLDRSGRHISLPWKVRGSECGLSKKYSNYLTLMVAFWFSFRHVQVICEYPDFSFST